MASEIEYVYVGDYVDGLPDNAETPSVDDRTVVFNSEDGFRKTKSNANALDDEASESDLNANSVVEIWTPTGKKKLPGDAIAQKSALDNAVQSIAPTFDPTRTSENPYKVGESVTYIDGKVYTFKNPHYGPWDENDVLFIAESRKLNCTDFVAVKGVPYCDFVRECYLSNISSDTNYVIDNISRGRNGNWYISINNNTFNGTAHEESSFFQLVNNKGYLIVDWSVIPEGQQLNNVNIPLSNLCSDKNNCPSVELNRNLPNIKDDIQNFKLIYKSNSNPLLGYVISNNTDGSVVSYTTGQAIDFRTTITAYYAKIRVTAGQRVLVPKIAQNLYRYAYPVLVDINNGYIATIDTRNLEDVVIDNVVYKQCTIPSDGYMIACSVGSSFSIYSLDPTRRQSVKHELDKTEKSAICDYIGAEKENKYVEVFNSSLHEVHGYIRTNDATSGEPTAYSVGDVLPLLSTVPDPCFAKFKVVKSQVVYTPKFGPTGYIYSYPVLVDINNGYIATIDTRTLEDKSINNVTYKRCIMPADGWLIVCKPNKNSFYIYSEKTFNKFFAPYELSDTDKDSILGYIGLSSNLCAKKENSFDYEVALKMNPSLLREIIESASNGKCTVIYDVNGYPSLMRRIPLTSIKALDSRLSDDLSPHPAFVVDGVQKKYIYAGVFMNSLYKGVPVSWWGGSLQLMRSYSSSQSKAMCADKGAGWHMETIWERSLLSLLAMRIQNTPKPLGNNNRGCSATKPFLYAESAVATDAVPGQWVNGRMWINGSQPKEWSHDLTEWGVFDLVGGYHEFVDLAKSVDGKIYLANDNNYSLAESGWSDTGAVITYDGNGIVFSNETDVEVTENSVSSNWSDIVCQSGYDNLSETIRKKLALALICPRLASSDSEALWDFDGIVQFVNGLVTYPFMGGALEYETSGLGRNYWKYPNTEAHNNMGSRLFYIE